jgi:tryptophan-rich sensory protein
LILNKRLSIFIFVFLALIIGGIASSASEDTWYQNLVKSDLNPPGYVFGIVWPILYILMSVAAYRTFEITKNPFFIQLIFNTMWSWLFFFFQMPFAALINIWILIYLNAVLTIKMYKLEKFSGLLYVPYVIWLLFASYLNLFIVLNN